LASLKFRWRLKNDVPGNSQSKLPLENPQNVLESVHMKIIEHPQNSHENSHECPGDVPSFPWHYCGYLPSTVEDPNALDPRTITTSSLRFAAVTAQMSFLEFFTSKFFTNTKNDQLFLKQNVIFNKFILKILDFSN